MLFPNPNTPELNSARALLFGLLMVPFLLALSTIPLTALTGWFFLLYFGHGGMSSPEDGAIVATISAGAYHLFFVPFSVMAARSEYRENINAIWNRRISIGSLWRSVLISDVLGLYFLPFFWGGILWALYALNNGNAFEGMETLSGLVFMANCILGIFSGWVMMVVRALFREIGAKRAPIEQQVFEQGSIHTEVERGNALLDRGQAMSRAKSLFEQESDE